MSVRVRSQAVIGAMVWSLGCLPAAAQDYAGVIEHCAGIEPADARIRCLEEAIRQLSEPPADEAVSAPAAKHDLPDPTPNDHGAAPVPADTADVAGEAVPAPAAVPVAPPPARPDPEPGPARSDTRTAATDDADVTTGQPGAPVEPGARDDAARAATPAASSNESTLDRMGAEQLPTDDDQQDIANVRVPATVVAFDFVGRDKLRVRLENDQVWRQIDADRGDFYPLLRNSETFEVELWQTSLGGYRMRILPTNRTVRVRRIQ